MRNLFNKSIFSNPLHSRTSADLKVEQEAQKKGKYDWKDAPLSVSEIAAICLDVAFGAANGGHDNGYAALVNSGADAGQKSHKAKGGKIEVRPSPLFVRYGHSTGDLTIESPGTLKYLQRRKYKELAGTGVGIAGSAASIGSMGHLPVNPVSILKQANTVGSTSVHLTKLKMLAKEIASLETTRPHTQQTAEQESAGISTLISQVIKLKAHKAGIEGAKLATSSIPVLGQIVTAGLTGGINATTSAVKTFDKAYHATSCARLAMTLHWLAYKEQFRSYCRMHGLTEDYFAREDYLAHPRPPRLTGMGLKAANETLTNAARPPRLTGMGLAAARQALDEHSPPENRKPTADFEATVKRARQNFYFDKEAGNATKIVNELFTRRSALAVYGHYDVLAIIMEPGGWVALTDKIASL
ncbi:hypothetical protein [Phyllobacterium myrsinacearum]|uniref:Uncharacterized protein n=1 Tax=Phyllobacterium myrsinacearum TaxID=28101 RepID=A0A839EQA4_9HYPH|nr:hypothetical protein [Phyllobacterium myrsinacearum]MBA8878810.1 hypothetical protein [Phyllobacterium myrsinacearum]